MTIPRTAIDFLTLEAIDGFLTMWVMRYPQFEELNPLVVDVAHSWLFPLQKIGLAILAIVFLVPLNKRFPRYVDFGFTVFSVFLIFILALNLVEIFR